MSNASTPIPQQTPEDKEEVIQIKPMAMDSFQDEYLGTSIHSENPESKRTETPSNDDTDYHDNAPSPAVLTSVYAEVAHKGRLSVQKTPKKRTVARAVGGFLSSRTPRKYTSTRYGRTSLNRTPRKEAKKRPLRKLAAKRSLMTKLSAPTPSLSKPSHITARGANVAHGSAQDLLETFSLIIEEMWSISGATLRHLKTPIAWGLVVFWCLVLLGFVLSTVQSVLQPMCIIPGISGSVLCLPLKLEAVVAPNSEPKQTNYSAMVDIQSQVFESLLEAATGGSALSLEMKKAEIATNDLVVQVRISDLQCKDVLAAALTQFAVDVRKTGRGLQKLAAKVGGAMDDVLAVNEYVLQSIQAARLMDPAAWSLTAVSPWRPRRNLDDTVALAFAEAMKVLSSNMQRLILEAEYSRASLLNLEERLTEIHEIVTQDDLTLSKEKSDLLAQLWTKLGGNRGSLRNFDSHLDLLKGLTTYRKQALVHVVGALETLYAMSEDMEDLRARVTLPYPIGSQVPVEVHMRSIQLGMERLQEGRTKSRKLGSRTLRKELSA